MLETIVRECVPFFLLI